MPTTLPMNGRVTRVRPRKHPFMLAMRGMPALRLSACDVSFPLRVGFDEHPLMLDGRVSLFGEGSATGTALIQDTRPRHLATAGEAPVTPREMRLRVRTGVVKVNARRLVRAPTV